MYKINFYDRVNAFFVNLVTPEIRKLKKIRKSNNYNNRQPTFTKPFPMNYEYLRVQGVKIRVARSIVGPDKPTIVLLSAFPQSIMAYAPVWKTLKSDFNLYAYDMPGFGQSETDSKFMTFKFQGEFLNSFLKIFDIEESHLVGPDVGMPAVLHYVSNCPNKIKSIMIGDGPAILPSSDGGTIEKMVKSSFWRFVFVMVGSGPLVESGKNICNVQYIPNKYEMSDFKCSYKGKVANIMQWFKSYPENLPAINNSLAGILTPTKIFWGEDDAILFKDNGIRLNEEMPNSEIEIFKNCGHFVYQDQYLRFSESVRSWVTKYN